jgi:hypothetical protein
MSGNTATGAGPAGIAVYGDLTGNVTLPLAGLPYVVDGSLNGAGLRVDAGATLTLPAGMVIKFRNV